MEKVDKTIEDACDWIQGKLRDDSQASLVPEMIKALAELVSARARYDREC